MNPTISPNLGLIQRPLPNNGPLVSMVKTAPGVYYDATGAICSDEMAALAGFDVKSGKREKLRQDAITSATADIEKKFKAEEDRIKGLSDDELDAEAAGGEPKAPAGEDDGEPFVEEDSTGHPVAVRLVTDGPVRERVYINSGADRGWLVRDRDSGKVYEEGLSKEDAVAELLKADEGEGGG